MNANWLEMKDLLKQHRETVEAVIPTIFCHTANGHRIIHIATGIEIWKPVGESMYTKECKFGKLPDIEDEQYLGAEDLPLFFIGTVGGNGRYISGITFHLIIRK